MSNLDPHGFAAAVMRGAVEALRLALRIIVLGLLALLVYVWSRSGFS